MQRHGDHMAYHDEEEAIPGCWDTAVYEAVAEPEPEKKVADDFEVAVPPGWAFAGPLALDEEDPGLGIEVEAAEHEDGVVEVGLVGDETAGCACVGHEALVVAGEEVSEEAVVDGEEGEVLVVWVVFGGVRYDVVDVVGAFPPAQGEAADGGGDYHADEAVDGEVVGDGYVGSVVGGEYKLRPEEAEEDGAGAIPAVVEEEKHGAED